MAGGQRKSPFKTCQVTYKDRFPYSLQREWAQNSENKLIAGVLLWDLSAAFDTLDADILVEKLKPYKFVKTIPI